MSELVVNNTVITNQDDIMYEQHAFYCNLYKKNIDFSEDMIVVVIFTEA